MKHVKLFTSFSGNHESLNEDRKITAGEIEDLLSAGDLDSETSDEFKKILIKKGASSDLLLRMAKALKWTKEEVRDLENRTESDFKTMEGILSLHKDNGLKVSPEDLVKLKKLLADKSRIMNAIKNL